MGVVSPWFFTQVFVGRVKDTGRSPLPTVSIQSVYGKLRQPVPLIYPVYSEGFLYQSVVFLSFFLSFFTAVAPSMVVHGVGGRCERRSRGLPRSRLSFWPLDTAG